MSACRHHLSRECSPYPVLLIDSRCSDDKRVCLCAVGGCGTVALCVYLCPACFSHHHSHIVCLLTFTFAQCVSIQRYTVIVIMWAYHVLKSPLKFAQAGALLNRYFNSQWQWDLDQALCLCHTSSHRTYPSHLVKSDENECGRDRSSV